MEVIEMADIPGHVLSTREMGVGSCWGFPESINYLCLVLQIFDMLCIMCDDQSSVDDIHQMI